jgi:hypothetical protein
MGKASGSPLISGILEVIYFAFFEVSMGITIGQKVLGLRSANSERQQSNL